MHAMLSAINNTDNQLHFSKAGHSISKDLTDAQPNSPKLTGLYLSTHLLVEAPSPLGMKGLAASPS